MKPRIVLSFLLLWTVSFALPAFADEATLVADVTPAESAVEQTVPSSDVEPSDAATAAASPFGTPTFVDTPGVCLGSDAPTPIGAAGLLGCPYGPTCYSDAQCAFACSVGTGVCGPDFCCWCIG